MSPWVSPATGQSQCPAPRVPAPEVLSSQLAGGIIPTGQQGQGWSMGHAGLKPRPTLPLLPAVASFQLAGLTVRTSLVVQWLRFCTPNAGHLRFDPWLEN